MPEAAEEVDHLENFYGKCHPMKTDEAGFIGLSATQGRQKTVSVFSPTEKRLLVFFFQVSRDIFGRDVDAAQMQMKTFCKHFLIVYI